MSLTKEHVHKNRSSAHSVKKGIISVVLLLLIVVVAALGCLSMDVAHGVLVREELQTATDAGALAGAQELARANLDSASISRAYAYASNVTAENKADNLSVSSSSPGTSVTVDAVTAVLPRIVTVTATRRVEPVFAKIIGWTNFPVSAISRAGAYKYVSTVRPDQVLALGVSLDHAPEKGPQKDKALNTIIGPGAHGQEFTIVLAPTKSENGAWIKSWSNNSSPTVRIGIDSVPLTNGTNASIVSLLQPGMTVALPLFKGKPPFNDSRLLVGVIGMEVTSVNFPHQITGRLKEQTILSGITGKPPMAQLDQQDNLFVDQWAPWQVMLAE